MFYGEEILTRSMSETKILDKQGKVWQYHSRSDAHSKAACWAILFDLLANCELLAKHALEKKVGFGINHTMHDWALNRDKDLDLVICTPANGKYLSGTFVDFVVKYGIKLTDEEKLVLKSLPQLLMCEVGTSFVALEAKACMTEHVKALPRLYDELTSSHQTIHGDTKNTIAVGFVMINTADSFISPGRNARSSQDGGMFVTEHKQPFAAQRVYEKTGQLGRRTKIEDIGFDAIGITFMKCKNDGSQIKIDKSIYTNLKIDSTFSYGKMIERIKSLYSVTFNQI